MLRIAIIILLLSVLPVLAQSQQQTPFEQALSAKLMEEINANIQLRMQLVQAQAMIKDLEAKSEKPSPKK